MRTNRQWVLRTAWSWHRWYTWQRHKITTFSMRWSPTIWQQIMSNKASLHSRAFELKHNTEKKHNTENNQWLKQITVTFLPNWIPRKHCYSKPFHSSISGEMSRYTCSVTVCLHHSHIVETRCIFGSTESVYPPLGSFHKFYSTVKGLII